MFKPPKGQPWNWMPAGLSPEIARLVARPILVVPFGGYGNAPLEQARKQSAIVNGSSSWVDSPYGPGMYFPNTVLASPTDYLSFRGSYPTTNAATVPHSIAILWQPRTSALHEPFCTAPGSGNRSVGIRGEMGTGFYAVHYGVVGFSGIGTVTANTYYLQLYSYDQVEYRMLVLNLNTGAIVSTSVAETRALSTASGGPRIGVQGANESLQGVVVGAAWVRGAWTIKEMEMLARNPTGIWTAPARRRISYVAPTGGGGSVTGNSSATIPLTGSASGSVGVTVGSSAPVPITGSASGSVAVDAASSASIPITGSAAASVTIDAASIAAIPVTGASTGSVGVNATSSQLIPITGTASASSAFTANSNAPIPITGNASVTVEVRATSSAQIAIAGAASITVGVAAVSVRAIPITGIADGSAGTGFDPSTLARAPHYIIFEALETSIDFDELATFLEFDDTATRLVFLTPQGVEMPGELRLIEGEVRDVEYVVRGAGGVPLDLTNSVTRKLTVRVPSAAPIVNATDVTVVGAATDGRLKLAATAAIASAAGRYKALTVITYPGGVIVKSPGEVLVETAIA